MIELKLLAANPDVWPRLGIRSQFKCTSKSLIKRFGKHRLRAGISLHHDTDLEGSIIVTIFKNYNMELIMSVTLRFTK